MNHLKLFLVLGVCLFVGINNIVAEEENPKTVFNENILIDYDIIGSSVIGGYNVTITNKIDGAALIIGNSIVVNSNIEYALISGQDITINGKIKDALVAGNNVILNESSNVERDIIIYGNNVEISGLINRDVTIYGNSVKIDSVQIAGNIKINATNINITENSAILGTLSYNDDAVLTKAESAAIGNINTFKVQQKNTFADKLKEHAVNLIAMVVVFAVVLLAFPKLFNDIKLKDKNYLKTLGTGFVTILVVPIVSIILIFTKLGLPVGIISLILYVICLYLSFILLGFLLGKYFINKVLKFKCTPYLTGIVGITILYVLHAIPYIGGVITFISIMYGAGIFINLYLKYRNEKKSA